MSLPGTIGTRFNMSQPSQPCQGRTGDRSLVPRKELFTGNKQDMKLLVLFGKNQLEYVNCDLS